MPKVANRCVKTRRNGPVSALWVNKILFYFKELQEICISCWKIQSGGYRSGEIIAGLEVIAFFFVFLIAIAIKLGARRA